MWAAYAKPQALLQLLQAHRIPDVLWRRIVQLRQFPAAKEPSPLILAPVIWEQSSRDVEAETKRRTLSSPGFSFSAAGLLFPYHLGVCHYLLQHSYIKNTTPLAGSSAGALVCAVVAAGLSMPHALEATKELADDCRRNGTAFRLGSVLRKLLDKVMPEDAHVLASGRIRVAITQLFRSPRGLLVDQFDSKTDLIDALLTSCFIPGYLAPRPVTLFKNRICIDGAFTLFMPPTSADVTVRVSAFSAKNLGLKDVVGISPDCNPQDRTSVKELFQWAIEPATNDVLDDLFNLGYKDAMAWSRDNPVEQLRATAAAAASRQAAGAEAEALLA